LKKKKHAKRNAAKEIKSEKEAQKAVHQDTSFQGQKVISGKVGKVNLEHVINLCLNNTDL